LVLIERDGVETLLEVGDDFDLALPAGGRDELDDVDEKLILNRWAAVPWRAGGRS